MKRAEEIDLTSLSDLLNLARDRCDPNDGWVFRGVTDINRHLLLPSIGRISKTGAETSITPAKERQLLFKFRDQVRPHIKMNLENDLEWLVLAQHHSLPTRLLDWTYSPLIAAYFATRTMEVLNELMPNGGLQTHPIPGGIYAVQRPVKVSKADRADPFKIDRIKVIDPPHVSDRVSRQVGLLTIHPTPDNPWMPQRMLKLKIAREHKLNIKFELDRLGVNEASLFPGVDATARYLGWRLKWDRLSDRPGKYPSF